MRKIAVVTGTRAEYSYLKPLMNTIKNDDSLSLLPVVTGMHCLPHLGKSHTLVEHDFPESKTLPLKLNGDEPGDMASYLADGILRLSTFFKHEQPHIIAVLGDRSEAFAAAIAGAYLNIPVAHINGGDVSGTTIDESIRHAITKLAHIHFVHTNSNAKRVERLGEEKHRIYVTGALTIDTIQHSELIEKTTLFQQYHLNPDKPTILMVHHPLTTIKDRGVSELKTLFSAISELQWQTVLIYPNCDAGSQSFINIIKQYSKEPYLFVFKNLSHVEYLSFMKHCSLMIGNSSSGIIEAPSFQIPVINIGTRQQGRERSPNILDVQATKKEIIQAIDTAVNDHSFRKQLKKCTNTFGDGTASEKMVSILKKIELSEALIQKQITY